MRVEAPVACTGVLASPVDESIRSEEEEAQLLRKKRVASDDNPTISSSKRPPSADFPAGQSEGASLSYHPDNRPLISTGAELQF